LDAACAALSVDAAAIPDRLLASAVEEFYQPLGEDSQSAAVQPPKSKQRFKLTRWMIFGIASATLLPLGFCALALFTGLPVLRSITSGPEPSAIPQIYIELTQTQLAEMVMLTQSTQTPLPTFTLEPTHTPPPSSRTRPSSTPRPTATARPNPTRTSPPPEPTRTATQVVYSSHKATITIHNNFPFPLYFYCDGVKLNKENPIPAKRYMWFNTISRGEHKFKLCNAYDTNDCPYEKVVEISDDWEIWVP
jgi:hypothetical protein